MRKIPPGAEASNILVGEVDFLDKPVSAFLRLNTASLMGDLTEVPVPTRFIFLLLGPVVSAARECLHSRDSVAQEEWPLCLKAARRIGRRFRSTKRPDEELVGPNKKFAFWGTSP